MYKEEQQRHNAGLDLRSTFTQNNLSLSTSKKQWNNAKLQNQHTDRIYGCWNIHPRTGIFCRKTASVGQNPLQVKKKKTSLMIHGE